MDNLDKIIEGLLFLSGDGLDRGVIMEKLQATPKELDRAIEKLKERYNEDCGINFITYKDKLQLCGNPKYADDVSLVLNPIRERQLTKATLEVMAIIAYKQPVTRLDVQDIRGINSDYAIQTLLNYKLIEVVGRKDAVGKPLLFGTTDEFLRHFGINSLDELPDYAELMKSVEQIQLENNHLYNEFEITDDENEQTFDELNINQKDKNTPLEDLNEEEKKENNNSVSTENLNNEYFKDFDLNQDIETMLEKEYYENNSNNIIDNQNVSKENIDNDENLKDDAGIDWSILQDNPDIEIE